MAQSPDGRITAKVHACFEDIIDSFPQTAILAVDIPIGLSDTGPRTCDLEARRTLGSPRGSSVFPAPLRAVLQAMTYQQACRIRQQIDGKKMSVQAWGIVQKVREVDRLLIADKRLARRVFEVHPEITFNTWAGRPLHSSKKTTTGHQERLALIESVWPGAVAQSRQQIGHADYQLDDLHDAFACLWTAQRIAAGTHQTIPATEEAVDSKGLPMRIVV